MELEATYGQLHRRDGKRQDKAAPGVTVTRAPARSARGRDRDTLFVHLTLSSQQSASATLFHETVEALADAFFQTSGSVTAALRQSVRAANEYLMRHNTRVEGVAKQQGGVTCAVLRDEEIFAAQAGHALAFVAHQGQVERLPPRQPGHVTPLGVAVGVDIRFYHSWVHPGDVLLLADPSFERHGNHAIESAVIYEGVTSALVKLEKLAQEGSEARLLLVEFSASIPEVRPDAKPEQPAALAQAEPSKPAERPPLAVPSIQLPRPSVDVDEVKGEARKAASGLMLGLAKITGGISGLIDSLFGGTPVSGQAVKKNQGPPPVALGFLAIVIPVLVALIAVTVYMQRGRAAQFQDLLARMDEETRLALAAGEPSAGRGHWEQVLDLSDDALKLRPSHETVLYFREQAIDHLDALDEVTRLTVRSLYQYQSGSAPAGLTVQSNLDVYVLDSHLGFLYSHPLEDEVSLVKDAKPRTLLFNSQAVADQSVGKMLAMTWFAQSDTGLVRNDAVAVLDDTGLLLRYLPDRGELIPNRLTIPPEWSTPVAIDTYRGTVYVLDTGAGRLWKFEAENDEFPHPSDTYRFLDNEDGDPSNDIDLRQMIDLAIDRDGNLYLLSSEGQILKFHAGERKLFELTDLKEPLAAPSAIFCSRTGLNPFFYIADPGSGRVVRTTHQGLFIAQYRARGAELADPFAGIRDFYVQEMPALYIYATSGDSVIVASTE